MSDKQKVTDEEASLIISELLRVLMPSLKVIINNFIGMAIHRVNEKIKNRTNEDNILLLSSIYQKIFKELLLSFVGIIKIEMKDEKNIDAQKMLDDIKINIENHLKTIISREFQTCGTTADVNLCFIKIEN